jgi:hypothetical protein
VTKHVATGPDAGAGGAAGAAEDTVPADSGPADGWTVVSEQAGTVQVRASGRVERYVFGEELGRGGMGRVVEATDSRLGRKVAVKEALPRGLDLRRRFEREVRITAKLEHPSIVPLYDAGVTAEGNPFYVMRKVSGQPLDKLIGDARTLDDRLMLVPNMLAAIDAIAHAHRRDIVHRDLKPGNVLVGEHGETVVIDWGLAKAIGEDDDAPADPVDPTLAPSDVVETQIGAVFGTPGFMAPEQARGEALDARSDVYALGACLYQLLSGRPPHHGTSATEVIDRALTTAPPALAALVGGVPPELVAIVDKALAYEPADRYPDAAALAEDVRRFLAGQLVAAHRYTPRQRLGRFLRKHRAIVGVSTLATVALAGVGVFSVRGVLHERDKAQRAEASAIADRRRAEEARDREADRADELLITQARALAQTNPTRALAALKLVSPGSRHWRAARMVAQTASAHGAAWAYPGYSRATTSLAIAPDGRRLLAAGEPGALQVIDLDEREVVLTADFGGRVVACWIDGGAAILVAPAAGGLVVVDAITGARRPIAWEPERVATTLEPSATGDRVALVDDRDALAVLDVARETITPVALDQRVDHLAVAPDLTSMLVSGKLGVRVVRPDGRVALRIAGDGQLVAVAGTGRRAAAIVDGRAHLIETGPDHARVLAVEPVPRTRIDQALHVTFAGDSPIIFHYNRRFDRMNAAGETWTLRQATGLALMGSEIRGGDAAFSGPDGDVLLFTRHSNLSIRAPVETQVKRVVGRANSRYVVATSENVILVWDLDRVTPHAVSTPSSQPVTWVDDDTLMLLPTTAPWRLLDVRSGKVTEIDTGEHAAAMLLPPVEIGDDGRILANLLPAGPVLVRPDTHRLEPVGDGSVAALALLSGNRFAYGAGGTVVVGTRREDRRVVLGAGEVHAIAAAGDGLFVVADQDVIQLDGGGREVARLRLPAPPSGGLVVDAHGLAVFGVGERVVRWTGARLEDLGALDDRVEALLATPAGILASTATRDHYLLDGTRAPRRVLGRTMAFPELAPGSGLVTAQLGDGSVVVIDLATFERTVLPGGPAMMMPSTSPDGRRVAIRHGNDVALWSLDVPSDPGAWAAWLDGLTNARPSTAPDVVWPWLTP